MNSIFTVDLSNKLEQKLVEQDLRLSLLDLHVLQYLAYAYSEYDESIYESWYLADWSADYKRVMFTWGDIHDIVEAGIYLSCERFADSVQRLIEAGLVKAELTVLDPTGYGLSSLKLTGVND